MRFAVFGAGVIGGLRSATVADNPESELFAVVDLDRNRAQAVASPFHARVETDYEALLGRENLDAVIVSTPTQHHEAMCLAALEAGCHVLCEKPLSNSVESCDRLLAAARSCSRTLAVGFNHRYYPSVQFLTQCLSAGKIGELDHLRVFGGHDFHSSFREDWMFKGPLSGGGSMMDVGIHMTDLINFVAGRVVDVSGVSTNTVWNVEGSEDNAMAIMRTERNIPVVYQATWTEWKGYRFFLEAYGRLGMVRAYYAPMFNLLITHDTPGGARRRSVKLYPKIMLREKLRGWQTTALISFEAELRDFIRMTRGESVRLADGHAGRLAVEVAYAVYRSSQTHETIHLSPT